MTTVPRFQKGAGVGVGLPLLGDVTLMARPRRRARLGVDGRAVSPAPCRKRVFYWQRALEGTKCSEVSFGNPGYWRGLRHLKMLIALGIARNHAVRGPRSASLRSFPKGAGNRQCFPRWKIRIAWTGVFAKAFWQVVRLAMACSIRYGPAWISVSPSCRALPQSVCSAAQRLDVLQNPCRNPSAGCSRGLSAQPTTCRARPCVFFFLRPFAVQEQRGRRVCRQCFVAPLATAATRQSRGLCFLFLLIGSVDAA